MLRVTNLDTTTSSYDTTNASFLLPFFTENVTFFVLLLPSLPFYKFSRFHGGFCLHCIGSGLFSDVSKPNTNVHYGKVYPPVIEIKRDITAAFNASDAFH
jgi:hypothetical protein